MRVDESSFKLWHSVDVRFKDIDLGGHAHHSLALVFFEEARAAYWKDVVGRGSLDEVDFIMAEARVRYHARILYPLRMKVGVRVATLGRKHFVMEYLIVDPEGVHLASGETTMIMYDYHGGRSKRVPDGVRKCIEVHEGLDRAESFSESSRPERSKNPQFPDLFPSETCNRMRRCE
ncbi:acyl-CoA thioesterase [Gemmatimonadota bacterium]